MSLSTIAQRGLRARPAPVRDAISPVVEFDVPLPPDLAAFGPSVRASLCGAADAPVVVVLGGISANRFPWRCPDESPGWWPGLVGEGRAIDPRHYRILGMDFGADESGRLAPSTRDQAAIICAALDQVGVSRAHAIVGASYGGMAALSLGQHFPDRAERLAIIAAGAEPHPAATAIRELQRRIVLLGLETGEPGEGLSIARGLAMLTYRTPAEFEARFSGGITGERAISRSEPGAYLRARGDAYLSVMSPQRFLSLSASIDRHRVDPARIRLPALLIGARTDQLVLASQMEALASQLAGPAALHILPSLFGHDMFLKEAAQLSDLIRPFLESDA